MQKIIYLILAIVIIGGLVVTRAYITTITHIPTSAPTQLECGGKRGLKCPTGYRCDIPEGVKDGMGVCIK